LVEWKVLMMVGTKAAMTDIQREMKWAGLTVVEWEH
jgi:hypothetical protein